MLLVIVKQKGTSLIVTTADEDYIPFKPYVSISPNGTTGSHIVIAVPGRTRNGFQSFPPISMQTMDPDGFPCGCFFLSSSSLFSSFCRCCYFSSRRGYDAHTKLHGEARRVRSIHFHIFCPPFPSTCPPCAHPTTVIIYTSECERAHGRRVWARNVCDGDALSILNTLVYEIAMENL